MRNVVLFGECGVGKSSIINAIIGQPVAKATNDVLGCTEENVPYSVILDGMGIEANLWDTIGLDEGTAGKIPADEAKKRLKLFLQKQIEAPEGVDILLYCIRGASRTKRLPIKQGHWDKYHFVFEQVCKKRVPIALVVTHLDSYDPGGDMDTWWSHSEEELSNFGFQFCAHACITTLPLEAWGADGDITRTELSKRRLQELLSQNSLAPRNVLLLGDCEDRGDFIDTMVTPRSIQNLTKSTSPFTCIPIAFDMHTHVNLWNMSGFNETDHDTPVTEKNLKLLVHGIKQTAGIDLLVFCFRAGRPKFRHSRNYDIFHAAICRKKVPVAIAVLGPEEGPDAWWKRNERDLKRRGFRFDRHVYIPCDPCQLPCGDLDVDVRRRLADLMQGEHTLGRWSIPDDPFWITVPNVRAVVGELSWPTTTVVVCDTTRQGIFANIAPGVQSSLRRSITSINPTRKHRFQQVDPQSFSLVSNPSSGSIQPRMLGHDQGVKGISLIVFFMPAEESASGSEAWRTLERFYSIYKGGITPIVVVVCGVAEQVLAEGIWRAAPRHIRRRIGASLTHHPGLDASSEAQAAAQEILADMIQDRCLVDLGERVGILRQILSVWRKYRSQRNIG